MVGKKEMGGGAVTEAVLRREQDLGKTEGERDNQGRMQERLCGAKKAKCRQKREGKWR